MEKIIEKIAKYEKCVQGLLDAIAEYGTKVEELPFEYWKDFRVANFGTRIGNWYSPYYYNSEREERHIIPSNVEDCGKSFYVHGDFNRSAKYATRAECVAFAKELPSLIDKLNKKLDALIENCPTV